jgi:hypothetical protein
MLAAAVMAGQVQAEATTDNIATQTSAGSNGKAGATSGDLTLNIVNLPSGFTLITIGPNVVIEHDPHTVTLSAAFLNDATYAASYYVMIESASAGTLKNGAGLVLSSNGVAIAAVRSNIPFSLPATPVLTELATLSDGPGLAKADAKAEISPASNSFLGQLPVPEPGTMELTAVGILILTEASRRGRTSLT